MAILIVIPSRKIIEEIIPRFAVDGIVVQEFLTHPAPDDTEVGAEVHDKYGYTWYLST